MAHRAPGVRSRPPPAEGPQEGPGAEGPKPARFDGLLFAGGAAPDPAGGRQDRSFARDVNLDQIVEAIAGKGEESELIADLLYRRLDGADAVAFRHEVFRDLEEEALRGGVRAFVDAMAEVRSHLAQAEKMRYQQQREGWFLDAAAIYCGAVRSLGEALESARPTSRGLESFRRYLAHYLASAGFVTLAADTAARKEALARVQYCTRIRGGRVDVSRLEAEPDYSAEVLKTFERFRQGAVKDYRIRYRGWPGMTHVGDHILRLVARLFPAEFSALTEFVRVHQGFLDAPVRRFEREVRFYLAYLDHIDPLCSAGLEFCYPEVSSTSKEVFAEGTFDLALAQKLARAGEPVVCNDFHLGGRERVIVVSGPNQGGKTTFARTFGQLHHLAGVGCPVPGTRARLFLFDRLFTHFEREEALEEMAGKLEDDLVRVKQALQAATPDSIVILNEIFTSTTLGDARLLGEKVMARLVQLDLLAVYVTFVDELSTFGESVVSMVSTIVPENPAQRTYKIVRAPADGLAYALAIADKHHLTYDRLRARLAR
ncbi:MAG: MutS-related protein [Candidatus Dormibacterales bacterium]